MTSHLLFALGVIAVSFLFARAEIEVEGPHGWATQLPTWRISNRWTRLFLGEKPLTGYHTYVFLMLLGLAHSSFFLGLVEFTLAAELRVISFFIFVCVLEDFLWFVLNPAFGLGRFRPENIWWHRDRWWRVAPRDYFIFLPLAVTAYYLSQP